jgi:hypothetical protein
LIAQSWPVKEQSACHFPMWYMPMHWAESIAYMVSIWKKIFYCFIKQPRFSFPSCNRFQVWGGGLTTAFYGWALLNKFTIWQPWCMYLDKSGSCRIFPPKIRSFLRQSN